MNTPHKRSFAAEELARRRKKKPRLGVVISVVTVIVIIGVVYILLQRFHVTVEPVMEKTIPEQEPITSIAVLPFKNLSADPDDAYFTDMFTDVIITQLFKIKKLKVISRTSVMKYKDSDKSLPEIARELDVSSILEGSVQRSGDRLQIVSQLIDARTDENLWAEIYNRKWEDVFEIQSDVARQIAKALSAELTPSEQEQLDKKPTESLDAFELYLLGKNAYYKGGTENLFRALDYYVKAIAIDPGFARAYSGIADVYTARAVWTYPALFRIAKAASKKALELDDTLAEANVSLATISIYYDYNWQEAERLCNRAISLNPSYEDAHIVYHTYLIITGRMEEALREVLKARELNPQTPVTSLFLMDVYGYLGRYDDAMEIYRHFKETNPALANYSLSRVNMRQGNYKEAIRLIESQFGSGQFYLAYLYAMTGERAKARKIFDTYIEEQKKIYASVNFEEEIVQLRIRELASSIPDIHVEDIIAEMKDHAVTMKRSYVNKRMVWMYTALGEYDRAFESLDRLLKIRGTRMPQVMFDPEIEPLRSDTRFKILRKKMGLPEN